MKNKKNSKITIQNIFLVGLFLLTALFILYFFVLRGSLAPEDASAGNNGKYTLSLLTPATLLNQPNNTPFTLSLTAQNVEAGDKVGEIVIRFDPLYVEGVAVTASSSLLSLNRNIDNANGIMTIDIAQVGESDLPMNTSLVTFDFKIKNNSVQTTAVSVDPTSTLGYPNRLGTGGYGTIALTYTSTPVVVANVCGDGNTTSGEQCDAGSNNGIVCQPDYSVSCNYCSSTCTNASIAGAYCGDSVKNGSEQCDDGNQTDTDSCTNACINKPIGNSGPVIPNPVTTQPTTPIVTNPAVNNPVVTQDNTLVDDTPVATVPVDNTDTSQSNNSSTLPNTTSTTPTFNANTNISTTKTNDTTGNTNTILTAVLFLTISALVVTSFFIFKYLFLTPNIDPASMNMQSLPTASSIPLVQEVSNIAGLDPTAVISTQTVDVLPPLPDNRPTTFIPINPTQTTT